VPADRLCRAGETIAEAALRELHEESGVSGRVSRLIDADSWKSDFYGDLLVVTFEAEKLSGEEVAGDDADEVAYFPIDRLPPLAFPSNEKAIRLCADCTRMNGPSRTRSTAWRAATDTEPDPTPSQTPTPPRRSQAPTARDVRAATPRRCSPRAWSAS